MLGAVEQVDDEKTADAITDFFIKTVTSATKPHLAKRPKDDEERAITSRAQVSTLFKQRRDSREEANNKGE